MKILKPKTNRLSQNSVQRKALLSAVALFVAVFFLSPAAQGATVIYSQTFAGGTSATLNGTAVQNGSGNWAASSVFSTNGNVATSPGSAVLAFTPVAGQIYELSATIERTSVAVSGWIGLGFANTSSTWLTTPNNSDFNNSSGNNPNGYSWMIFQRKADGNNQHDRFLGAGVTAPGGGGTVTTGNVLNLKIVLDTTGTLWTTKYYVGGVQNGLMQTYTTNPVINSVGFTTNNDVTGIISNFSLTAVPEPSPTLLAAFGFVSFFFRRRR